MFLDELIISVQSGRGGNGCESYMRRSDRKMIPDGGDGGKGGDVILRAASEVGSLIGLRSKRLFEAQAGGFGKGTNRYGRHGESLVLRVPCGTTVYDHTNQLLIRDLAEAGDEVVVAKGGRGGYGNHSGRPRTMGEEGKLLELSLSFTIPAEIFLVGLPTSGKTSLLKYLTGARVEPADYPFATKAPCLGTYSNSRMQFRICELPSLYGHSSEGRGLGTAFLKQLNRARLIFLVLDPGNPFADHLKSGYDILLKQIDSYDARYLKIPRFVVINKMDLVTAKERSKIKSLKFQEPVFYISTKRESGISGLMKKSEQWLARNRD